MKLYLQRHTQPYVDPKLCYGVSDVDLHYDFLSDHLPQVLDRINGIKVDQLYSSPLQRCRKLAIEIQKTLHIKEIIFDNQAVELNFGEWELMSWDEIYKTAEGKSWFEDYLNRRVPQGESFVDMVKRAEDFINRISGGEENIMLVTHSGFIRAVMVAAGVVSLAEAFDVKVDYGTLVELTLPYSNK